MTTPQRSAPPAKAEAAAPPATPQSPPPPAPAPSTNGRAKGRLQFEKATPQKSHLKVTVYAKQGAGKTRWALLAAEVLQRGSPKRIAMLATERGYDFYLLRVAERVWHPEPFDFDVVYSPAMSDALDVLRHFDTDTYGTLVIDQASTLWQSAIAAYRKADGPIPMHLWDRIKAPWYEMMHILKNLSCHVILLGREGAVFGKDQADGEMIQVGTKFRGEGEVGYELDFNLRLVAQHDGAGGFEYWGWFEKDRSGLLGGKAIPNPGGDLVQPLLSLLGNTAAYVPSQEETAVKDQRLTTDEEEKKRDAEEKLGVLFAEWTSALTASGSIDTLRETWKDLNQGALPAFNPAQRKALEKTKDVRKAELLKGI